MSTVFFISDKTSRIGQIRAALILYISGVPICSISLILLHQCIVRTMLNNLSLFHDIDFIAGFDGIQPVCNDNADFVLCNLINRAADVGFRHDIQITDRLIQNQNIRLAENGSGNGKPLFLSAGEIGAAKETSLREGCIEPVEQMLKAEGRIFALRCTIADTETIFGS